MLPGKWDFYRCCLVRRSASHVNKEFRQQFQNYAPPSLRVISTKFARTVKPLLSGLLRCGHLPLPDIIKNRVVFCFCQINLGGASGLVACVRMAIITIYSVLHYIVLVSLASTTRRKRSMLTLEKKLEIIVELKKGKSLRYLS